MANTANAANAAEHTVRRTDSPGIKHTLAQSDCTLALQQSQHVIDHPASLVQTAHEGRKEQGVTDGRVKLRNPMNPENVESGRNSFFY